MNSSRVTSLLYILMVIIFVFFSIFFHFLFYCTVSAYHLSFLAILGFVHMTAAIKCFPEHPQRNFCEADWGKTFQREWTGVVYAPTSRPSPNILSVTSVKQTGVRHFRGNGQG